ncbi:metalloregulator ArsR/SmtB family transcription factor [Rhodococcus antarcticus]|uniref:Metalloregulator ArsR/SmtB family transcription factor n=1 Tax=Rhodococcus antarcticus TaxID=2987751 RepID=A0ABY6NY36_9NOCA|nr:metalloregulator ArsR/SmtB family transcription factor [Rhodococcus antarcticus]UZJ24286.1 metalloregulator ArsR/SmtB family transcription factor [Rhodococcus antarcticus]
MHHLTDDLAESRVLDAGRVCDAVARIRGGAVDVARWAQRAALLGDEHRLKLCLALHCSREICVTDLAAAAQMSESATSHALRLLRAEGAVAVRRDGRLALYRLVDDELDALLHAMGATSEHTPHAPHH